MPTKLLQDRIRVAVDKAGGHIDYFDLLDALRTTGGTEGMSAALDALEERDEVRVCGDRYDCYVTSHV